MPELNPKALQALQQRAYHNHLFALYIEYIVSKSTAPKEMSDIVGLQNLLFSRGMNLIDISNSKTDFQTKNDDEEGRKLGADICQIQELMNNVDPQSITKKDINEFLSQRIRKNDDVKNDLCEIFDSNKNNFFEAASKIQQLSVPDNNIIVSDNEDEFEIGGTLAMMASKKQQTAYSHEPIGIIVDVPAIPAVMSEINFCLKNVKTNEEITALLENIQLLIKHTESYDEKQQMGGRALRTPKGHVSYMESQTDLNDVLHNKNRSALMALQVETSFSDIFNADEEHVKQVRASTTFNRFALKSLESDAHADFESYTLAICQHVKRYLADETCENLYTTYIQERLPFLWTMRYHPEHALAYYKDELAHFEYQHIVFEQDEQKQTNNLEQCISNIIQKVKTDVTTTNNHPTAAVENTGNDNNIDISAAIILYKSKKNNFFKWLTTSPASIIFLKTYSDIPNIDKNIAENYVKDNPHTLLADCLVKKIPNLLGNDVPTLSLTASTSYNVASDLVQQGFFANPQQHQPPSHPQVPHEVENEIKDGSVARL